MRIFTRYTTRERVKALMHVPLDDTSSDANIDRAIDAATAYIERITQRFFVAAEEECIYDWHHPQRLRLQKDLLELVEVRCSDGQALLPEDIFLSPTAGPPYRWLDINLASGKEFSWALTKQRALTVEALWGYSSSPPHDIVQACNELAIQILNASGDAGLESIAIDFAKHVFDRDIPPLVAATLARYRSVAIA